jgi:hypothetical protein
VSASPGAQRGLRLRLSSDGGVTTPTGEGGSGEIEDYVVRICPADLIQPETAQSGRLGTPYLQTFTAPAGTTPRLPQPLESGVDSPAISTETSTHAAISCRTYPALHAAALLGKAAA